MADITQVFAQLMREQRAEAGKPVTETWLQECGFQDVRAIGGVLCGTQDYLTTRAVVVGIDRGNYYERRYCYQDRREADAALAAYRDPTQHPSGHWIKLKGRWRGELVSVMNPNHPDFKPWDEGPAP